MQLFYYFAQQLWRGVRRHLNARCGRPIRIRRMLHDDKDVFLPGKKRLHDVRNKIDFAGNGVFY